MAFAPADHTEEAFRASRAVKAQTDIRADPLLISQAAAASLTQLKGFFPGRTLPKGSPLELFYSSSNRTVLFQTKVGRSSHALSSAQADSRINQDVKEGTTDVLGTLTHKQLAKELFLSYFSDTLETSPELRKSVALGLAGEPRTAAPVAA